MLRHRAGIQAVEVIVTFVVVALIILVVLTALPRQREGSRRAACQQNLSRIGIAVVLFDQSNRTLPGVPDLASVDAKQPTGPVPAMLSSLSQPDFSTMQTAPDGPVRPKPRARPTTRDWRIVGLLCPSDRNAMSRDLQPSISYRATTGSNSSGTDGAFAPGRTMSLKDVADADGTGFTAAFSERLVGTRTAASNAANYALVDRPVGDQACPSTDGAWRGDAGSSWAAANWTSTLYNHAMVPGASPSCIARDGLTARMGASSGHAQGSHVLLFDLSVRTYGPTVNPKVWRELANVNDAIETGR